jgi:hypothetical protein
MTVSEVIDMLEYYDGDLEVNLEVNGVVVKMTDVYGQDTDRDDRCPECYPYCGVIITSVTNRDEKDEKEEIAGFNTHGM